MLPAGNTLTVHFDNLVMLPAGNTLTVHFDNLVMLPAGNNTLTVHLDNLVNRLQNLETVTVVLLTSRQAYIQKDCRRSWLSSGKVTKVSHGKMPIWDNGVKHYYYYIRLY